MDVNVAKPEVRNDDVLAYQTGDPADWPPELDAVIAAPHEHSVLFENDRVRVLEVNIAPGTTEPVHHHRWPSVLYLTSGSEFIDRAGSGEVLNDSRMRDVPLAFPFAMWKEPEAPHYLENLSSTEPIHLLRFELK